MIKDRYNKGVIIIASVLIIAMVGGGCVNKAPKIEITPSSYDFGVIPYEKVEHAFLVKNTGTDVLEINGLSTSCGCTKATVESETIMPGKTTNLLVTFDPNIMGDDEVGDILRVIYIKSNDPNQPEVEVEIKANVKK